MRTISMLIKAFAVAAMFYATQASAYFYVDDTTGSPTYNRPFADLSQLSGTGTAVPYDSFAFSVDTAGSYTFNSFALPIIPLSGRWDNMLFLYQGSFNPASPLTNALIGNDDLNAIGHSGFSFGLTTGVAYVLVTTGFNNTSEGKYLNTIQGPGNVTAPVPEPETYALLLSGLGVVGFLARRRRQG